MSIHAAQQQSDPWKLLRKLFPRPVPFDTPSIKAWVDAILATPNCRAFANTILAALGKKRKGLGTLEEIASAFFAQKGKLYTRNRPDNSRGVGNPLGSLSAGRATIFSNGSWSFGSSTQLLKDVDTVIAELFHLAAKDRHYTDKELAEAVNGSRYASDANMPIGPNKKPLISPTRNIFDPRY